MAASVVNVAQWLEESRDQFHPPVCNKMLSDNYMKIMFVGGPNSRKDYHLDQGEEFFLMVKGDMLLKVMEKGQPKDIRIREGETFRLPSRIPHSPQRFENTIGLVIERQRKNEWDGLRYYCEDDTTILWQKFFHLKNLVKDMPPVFDEYFSSEQFKTGQPIPGTTDDESGDEPGKFVVDKRSSLEEPFSLESWIQENSEEIKNGGKVLFGGGEFNVVVYGQGTHCFKDNYEMWYWHRKGEGVVRYDKFSSGCKVDDSVVLPAEMDITIEIKENGLGILFKMDALGNLPTE